MPFLKLTGIVAGGWQMARAALIAQEQVTKGTGDKAFYEAKILTARFFAEHVLSQAGGLRTSIMQGARGVLQLSEEQL